MVVGKTIALFGGAFDPVTKSHIEIMRLVGDIPRVDMVRVMPCLDIHPFGKRLTPVDIRREMLVSCLPPGVFIDNGQAQTLAHSDKTYDILKHMQACSPEDTFMPVIGLDEALVISKWYQWEKLIEEYGFIVIERPQDVKNAKPVELMYWRMHHIYISPSQPLTASSSSVRQNFKDFWGKHNGDEAEAEAVYEAEFSDLIHKSAFHIAVKNGLYKPS
jgi:nicotinate (nicotinamide) nucleotide adenylyltransferase